MNNKSEKQNENPVQELRELYYKRRAETLKNARANAKLILQQATNSK